MNIIQDTIKREVVQVRGHNCWLSRRHIIQDMLDKLQPSIPEDGSIGRIAYNVPGKDRMKIKTGKFLVRKLNLNNRFLLDKSIAAIADIINSKLFPDIKTELVNNKQITENYRRAIGSESCMTGDCAEYTKLYESNPDRFQMLTMFYMADSARAIVHKLDNGQYFLDRVYASCEMLKEKMQDYAIGYGWYERESLTSKQKQDCIVSDLNYNDGEIPYMDSLTFGCTCNGGLTISMRGCCDYELTNQNGQLETGYMCESCEEHITEDEHICIGDYIYCQGCADERYSCCERCDEYIINDDIVHIADNEKYVCSYCVNEIAHQCEDCGEYNENDYFVIENQYYCENCAEAHSMCAECCEQFIDSDCIDENGLCEDCRPEEVAVSRGQLNLPDSYPGQMEINYAD